MAADNKPMAAAPILYNQDGSINWRDMWANFCDLAIDGGPSHRGPDDQLKFDSDAMPDEAWAALAREIIRGIEETSGLPAIAIGNFDFDTAPKSSILIACRSQEHASWMTEAINAEGVEATKALLTCVAVPCNNDFALNDIKSVITAVAKTAHYWDEHGALYVTEKHLGRSLNPVASVRDRYRK